VAKDNFRLTCNLVSNVSTKVLARLTQLTTKEYANEGSQNKALELSKFA
jgi:hypothetical protein